MKPGDKSKLKYWNQYRDNILKATPIDLDETASQQQKRIDYLLAPGNETEFFKHYFPNFCGSDFANFQNKSIREICDNPTIFATLAFSRDHAKSVLLMMIIILLYRRGEINNFLLVSYNAENAMDLIRPIKIQFETNQRLIHDFGILKGPSQWTNEKFITTDGVVFRSIGTGQNPRGARDEEDRPDFILFDDADDDELCRNPARLDKSWEWLMGALFGCFSIKGNKRFIGVGNIIAKDSIMVRASRKSDFHLQINILRNTTRDLSEEIHYHKNLLAKEEDENQIKLLKMALGYLDKKMIPSWHQRFTLLEVCYMIEKMGYRLSQREYFNNPLTEGKVFKKEWFQFGKMPNLRQLRFKLSYLDPGFKKTKSADTKSWILMGLHEGKYYILKAFCGVGSINEMIMWGYEIQDYLNRKNAASPMWMEEVFLQDLLYKDFAEVAKTKGPLPLQGDTRKKPDKDSRIESISGYFERGNVIFNEDEKESHHMLELHEQFFAFEPGVKTKKDGPDAMEGGMWKLNQMIGLNADINVGDRAKSKYKI